MGQSPILQFPKTKKATRRQVSTHPAGAGTLAFPQRTEKGKGSKLGPGKKETILSPEYHEINIKKYVLKKIGFAGEPLWFHESGLVLSAVAIRNLAAAVLGHLKVLANYWPFLHGFSSDHVTHSSVASHG